MSIEKRGIKGWDIGPANMTGGRKRKNPRVSGTPKEKQASQGRMRKEESIQKYVSS